MEQRRDGSSLRHHLHALTVFGWIVVACMTIRTMVQEGMFLGQAIPIVPGLFSLRYVMLYEMAINLGIFALLWRLRTRPSRDGFLFGLHLLLSSAGRFVVEFFRADSLMLGRSEQTR